MFCQSMPEIFSVIIFLILNNLAGLKVSSHISNFLTVYRSESQLASASPDLNLRLLVSDEISIRGTNRKLVGHYRSKKDLVTNDFEICK